MPTRIPTELRTFRLLLRPWRASDAPALLPLLKRNVLRLSPWIPAHVATPVPLPELEERLAGFANDFALENSFRYALIATGHDQIVGEMDLFPRAASGRVPLGAADRVELGYWLDEAHTGQGLVTEATRALLDVARALPEMQHAEIRCDIGNVPSAAVPNRLGFHLAMVEDGVEVWQLPFGRPVR